MKKVLFIGVTKFDFRKAPPVHLQKKYLGLSKEIEPHVLGKGKLSCQKGWGASFYLLPPRFYWPLAFCLGFYLCLAKKIDVIVAQSPLIEGLVGAIFKNIFRKELIVEIHGDWEQRLPRFKNILSILAKFSLRNADKIRGVANYLILRAKKYAPNKPYFLFPTFTDLDDFLEETDIRFDNYILFVGRADRVKGINYLIEAFDKIKLEFPEFKLVLVGEGLGSNSKLKEKIEFKGRLSLKETKDIMKNCYCLVLPSLSEGLPRVIMEAQALGKPVIGSNVGGIPELIEDGQNGFLFKAGDSGDLAEKLRILLKDKKMALEMGQRGREFVKEKFSNEKYTSSYLEMINI